MGMIPTEQTVAIIKAVGEAIPEPVMKSEPNMAFGMLALLALLPMVAGGVVAWFKRHLIIGWVKNRKKK